MRDMISSLVLFVSFLILACAKSSSRRTGMSLHGYVTSVPAGFVNNGPADPKSILDLRIALVQNDKDGLIEALHNISTPGNPSFGQHLSSNESAKFTAPSPQTVAAVNTWLQGAGLNASTITPAGDWLQFNTTVRVANELLGANFSVFTHIATGKQTIRTANYSIPTDLVGHIEFIHPTISFPSPSPPPTVFSVRARGLANAAPDDCTPDLVTPYCVYRIYGIPLDTVTPAAGSIGVVGINDEYANEADLSKFMVHFRPDVKVSRARTFKVEGINGGQNPQDPKLTGVEANTDIQYTVGIASGVPVTFFSVARLGDYFIDLITYLLGQNVRPSILTVSYSVAEADVPKDIAERICHGFAELAAEGMSVIFSSGDGGVGGPSVADRNKCTDGKFVPTFPPSCPYVTTVGATTLQTTPSGGITETGAQYSGGGFSNYFTNQESRWQRGSVQQYLQRIGSLHKGKFNPDGRALPDVSVVGTNELIYFKGNVAKVFGTSSSAPIFASIIALINVERGKVNKRPLGFLNEFLYMNPQAFKDITSGRNPGCNTDGFEALKDWDAITGLGTPQFDALKAAGLAW
ncbi:hypothetical protein NM688_g8659 [Phlebia brevispora]|uniref:Uncharacterized protein n=1 Tax=Phlebia brevispora TaxID=194682 RepID=A0ACC1RRY5_9APHY|nr:hypothetical protein NM688_g8659 [Phlebia brevispora]